MTDLAQTPTRPFIHLNLAIAGNGPLARSGGASQPRSSALDWHRVHLLRERYDAVAIGIRAWRKDHPLLLARRERLGREAHRQPQRVIFAGSQPCAIPADGRRTFVVGSSAAVPGSAIWIPSEDHGLLPPLCLLHQHGIRSLLVEGGPTLLRSFLLQGLFDCLTLFVRADSPEPARRLARALLRDLPPTRGAHFAGGILLVWGMPWTGEPSGEALSSPLPSGTGSPAAERGDGPPALDLPA